MVVAKYIWKGKVKMGVRNIIGIHWDGHGQADLRYGFQDRSTIREGDGGIGTKHSTCDWVPVYDGELIIHQDAVDTMVREIRNSHRILHENSQSNNQLVLARNNAERDVDRYRTQNFALQ